MGAQSGNWGLGDREFISILKGATSHALQSRLGLTEAAVASFRFASTPDLAAEAAPIRSKRLPAPFGSVHDP